MPKTRRVTFRLEMDRAKQIEDICEKSGCTLSDFITGAINKVVGEGIGNKVNEVSDKETMQNNGSIAKQRQEKPTEQIGRTERGEPVYRCGHCGELFALHKDRKTRSLEDGEGVIMLAQALSKKRAAIFA